MSVGVQSRDGVALMACSEKRARQLLKYKRAVIASNKPFTIKLNDRDHEDILMNNPINRICMEDDNNAS